MFISFIKTPTRSFFTGLVAGLALLSGGAQVWAGLSGPSEHQGLTVSTLEELSEETMTSTIGLTGYTMRMRAIEIEPGGQIAEHSHKDRPGIVTVVDGAWVEGRPDGERIFEASELGTFPENESTIHWVYNRTDAPATALVCDIAKTN